MLSRRNFVAAASASLMTPQLAAASAAAPSFVPDARFVPQYVRVKKNLPVGRIIIWPEAHYLYLITEQRKAIRYGVAVGKEGLGFYGTATIDRKVEWPSWRPTASMIARDPKYKKWEDGMPGGANNPLGARALYFYQDGRDTMIRIHGTTKPGSIGTNSSNGCFRMINDHVAHLYDRVPIGTIVHVLGASA